MTIFPNSFMTCSGHKATLTDCVGVASNVSVQIRPEVQEFSSELPYVVRKSGFLVTVRPGVIPVVGGTLTYNSIAWRIAKVVYTTYCNHYGLSTVLPTLDPSCGNGEPVTLSLKTSEHLHGCDAQDNPSAAGTDVKTLVLHNASTENVQDEAREFAESWRIYVEQAVAETLTHDSLFERSTRPGVYYKVQRVVDLGRFDRMPYALTKLVA